MVRPVATGSVRSLFFFLFFGFVRTVPLSADIFYEALSGWLGAWEARDGRFWKLLVRILGAVVVTWPREEGKQWSLIQKLN